LNILVVDSDPIQLQSLARGLKGRGHSVVTATDKTEVFSLLEEPGDPIHLILTDLKIPQLNAFELATKARVGNEMFPVIIMTTFISPELKNKIQHQPCTALIEKPFGLEKLIQLIEGLALSYNVNNCSL